MMRHSIPGETNFVHVVLEGTSYEVGRQQGEMLKNDPQRSTYLAPHLPFLTGFTPQEAQVALKYIETYCPGLREEIQGAADASGVPVEEIAFLGGRNKENGFSAIPMEDSGSREVRRGSFCSHFAVLPPAAADRHMYAAQNIDSSPSDLDLRLCTTRVRGKPAHIGFSDMIFGRLQGLNEHGFCVTTSWGAPMMWPSCHGLPYFAVVRALLDRSTNVADAVEVLTGIPVAWCTNFILSDAGGNAALVEIAGEDRGVRETHPAAQGRFQYATNHYTLPELQAFTKKKRRESITRRQIIETSLERAVTPIDQEMIRGILSRSMPEGVGMPYYSSGMGTLWSMIFDVTDRTVEICFGNPGSPQNTWHTYGLYDAAGSTQYKAHIPDRPAPEGFWQTVE